MGEVFEFPKKGQRIDRAAVLTKLLARQQSGDLKSFMYFSEGEDGVTNYGVYGGFADRLQYTAHTLIQALHTVSDRIADSGSAGRTRSPSIRESLPRRPLPRDLKGSK